MGKILHIDWLDKNMKSVIKTLFDADMADVFRMYGFDYVTPRWGEPIFIPFEEFSGKYRNVKTAYEKVLQKVKENENIGLQLYKNWFSDYVYFDHYRFVEFSFTDPNSGMIVGIGAEPLTASKSSQFDLNSITDIIKDKKVYIANQALLANIVVKGALTVAKDIKMGDEVMNRRDEIIEFYHWINEYRHNKYDKENVYNREIAENYMKKGFELMDSIRRQYITDKPEGEIALLPVFVIPKKKRTNSKSIRDAWTGELKEYLNNAEFHEIEPSVVVMSYSVIEQEIEKLKGFETIIVLFNKAVKPLQKCDDCPEALKSFNVKYETDKVKILTT